MTTWVVRPKGYVWDKKICIKPTPEKELKKIKKAFKEYFEKLKNDN